MTSIWKTLVFTGLIFIILGGVFFILNKIGLGKLPGDISIQRGKFMFYFPVATMILVSIILSLALSFFIKK